MNSRDVAGIITRVDSEKKYVKVQPETSGSEELHFSFRKLWLPSPLEVHTGDEVVCSVLEEKVLHAHVKRFKGKHTITEFYDLLSKDPSYGKFKTEAITMCAAAYFVTVSPQAHKSLDSKKKNFELLCEFISKVPSIEEPYLQQEWAANISPVLGLAPLKFRDVFRGPTWLQKHLELVKKATVAVYKIRPTTAWIEIVFALSKLDPGFQIEVLNSVCHLNKYNKHSRGATPVGTECGVPGSINAMTSLETLKEIPLDRGYVSSSDFLDINFKLLRADSFYPLATTIEFYKECRTQRLNTEAIPVYTDVTFDIVKKKKSISYRVSCTPQGPEMVRAPRLDYGNLVALSMSGEFRDGVERDIFWAMIDREPTESEREHAYKLLKDHNSGARISFDITFCKLANGGPEFEGEAIFSMMMNFDTITLIDSDAFLLAFEPILGVLRGLNSADLPFQNEIVHAKQVPENAPPKSEQNKLMELLETRKDLYGTLDPGQIECYKHFAENRLALIQGPPGTGKSYLGTRIAYALNSVGYKSILIMSYKNHSLDDFIIDLHDILGSEYRQGCIARVGKSPKTNPKVFECMLDALEQVLPVRGTADMGKLSEELKVRTKNLLLTLNDFKKAFKKLDITYNIFMKYCKGLPKVKDFLEERDERNTVEANFCKWKINIIKKIVKEPGKRNPNKIVYKEKPKDFSDFYEQEIKASLEEKRYSEYKARFEEATELGKAFYEEREESSEKSLKKVSDQEEGTIILSNADLRDSEFAWLYSVYIVPDEEALESYVEHIEDEEAQVKLLRGILLIYYKEALDNLRAVTSSVAEVRRNFLECKVQSKAPIVSQATYVCCTSTGSGTHHSALKDIKPDALIIEEAGEIPEPVLAAALYPSLKRIVMIGDHKQLRPSVNTIELRSKNLNVSTFERLVRMKLPCSSLYIQNRMLDSSLWPVQLYYDRLETNFEITKRIEPASWFGNNNVFWWTHNKNEDIQRFGSRSRSNSFEAERVEIIVGFLLAQDEYQPQDIIVLTPYIAQVSEIKNTFMRAHDSSINGIRNVLVKTIDEFQGDEARIIILSLVRGFGNMDEDQEEKTRNARNNKIGFLREENRLIVAISRHKAALVIIGNSEVFGRSSNWRKLVDACEERKVHSDKITFKCPRHGKTITLDDSVRTPARGCSEQCGGLMECGHCCSGRCHDPNKVPHDRCNVIVHHKFPCGHERDVRCYELHDEDFKAVCTEFIITRFSCGHSVICNCKGVKDSGGKPVFYVPPKCTHRCKRTVFHCGHTCQKECGHNLACDNVCKICMDAKRFGFVSCPPKRAALKEKKKGGGGGGFRELSSEDMVYMLQVMEGSGYTNFSMLINHVFPMLDVRYIRIDDDYDDMNVMVKQNETMKILLKQMNIKVPEYFSTATKVWPFLTLKEYAGHDVIENFEKLCEEYLPTSCIVRRDSLQDSVKAANRKANELLQTLISGPKKLGDYIIRKIKDGKNQGNYAKWLDIPIEDAADILNRKLGAEDLDYIPSGAAKLNWGIFNNIKFSPDEEKEEEEEEEYKGKEDEGDNSNSSDNGNGSKDKYYPTRAYPPKYEISHSHFYKKENVNGYFVSIDIKRANYTILKLYEPEFVDNTETWEEFVRHAISEGKFYDYKGFEYFKLMRESTLGKLCHEKISALEAHILRLVVRAIVRYYLENSKLDTREIKSIFAFSCDELLIRAQNTFGVMSAYDHVLAAIRKFLPNAESFLRVEAIKLLAIDYSAEMEKKQAKLNRIKGTEEPKGFKFQQDTYRLNDWKWKEEEKRPLEKNNFYVRMTLKCQKNGEVITYVDETTEAVRMKRTQTIITTEDLPPFTLKCITDNLIVDGIYQYITKYREPLTYDQESEDDEAW